MNARRSPRVSNFSADCCLVRPPTDWKERTPPDTLQHSQTPRQNDAGFTLIGTYESVQAVVVLAGRAVFGSIRLHVVSVHFVVDVLDEHVLTGEEDT